MPTGLDVAAWLGATDARAIAREVEELGKSWDIQLDGLVHRRAHEEARHGSVVASALEALGAYLAPSLGDGVVAAAGGAAWKRRKIEVALGGWTTLRHDALALARLPSPPTSPAPPWPPAQTPVFVEPHPEAIAQLLAAMEQASRGLVALGALAASPAQGTVAGEAMAMLRTCLSAALHEANDEPIPAEEAAKLADLPAHLVDLEARLAPVRAADRPLVVDVHTDLAANRVLEEGIGAIDDLYMVVREPTTGRMLLTLGAAIAHHELAQPAALRMTDDEWRARILANPPARAAWTDAYVVGSGSGKAR
jgi:hypothetical protein